MEIKKYYELQDRDLNFTPKVFRSKKSAKKYLIKEGQKITNNDMNTKHPMTKENCEYWQSIKYDLIEIIVIKDTIEENLDIK